MIKTQLFLTAKAFEESVPVETQTAQTVTTNTHPALLLRGTTSVHQTVGYMNQTFTGTKCYVFAILIAFINFFFFLQI